MEVTTVDIENIIPYVRNPRKNSEAVSRVAGSLKEFGWQQPIVVDKDMVVIAGHTRLSAAQQLGMDKVPIAIAEGLTEAQVKAYRIADNRSGEAAEWDLDLLSLELEDLKGMDFDLDLTGFDDSFIKIEEQEGLTDEDAVPEVPEIPKTVLDDVWILGNHRLMCGDSTSIDAVEKLMDGKKASLVVTDPPWNVSYGKNMPANNAQGYKPREIMNDSFKEDADWIEFLSGIMSCMSVVTNPGCPVYCVMGASEWPAVDKALRDSGFHWSSTIIWAKDSLVLSRKDYHTQYEPIWYGWKGDAARIWVVKDRKQSDLWECKRPKISKLHPTTKPVELIERAITNSSNTGVVVYEPFGGSGSTLIASHKNNRKCMAMELDPKYCDVIINRWQDFTGKEAKHEDGRLFNEI